MTITVNIGEADLADLLARVEAGEDIILARDDVPVARMVAVQGEQQPPLDMAARKQLMDSILEARKTMSRVTQDEIAEWKQIGRR
jgi:antitoxin (DNA-binding transcriptional repressor) of toxin-antitoxin stability system